MFGVGGKSHSFEGIYLASGSDVTPPLEFAPIDIYGRVPRDCNRELTNASRETHRHMV
jgi:hypothetical protein